MLPRSACIEMPLEVRPMKSALLWFAGVPVILIILLNVFGVL
ncbi:hypothetical protein C8P66_116113 [Humitalea rosea]|uniref:Uncharacterized protein n=1 Tax=Humitalea rosea TaxID=990373 RepID=A0A2W7IC95_9PROT|nr:hypothetical protein C8P66_116113 [Humitalea rosea]